MNGNGGKGEGKKEKKKKLVGGESRVMGKADDTEN